MPHNTTPDFVYCSKYQSQEMIMEACREDGVIIHELPRGCTHFTKYGQVKTNGPSKKSTGK